MKVIITDVESRKAFDLVNIMQRLYGYDCILCASKDFKVQLPLIFFTGVRRLRSGTDAEFAQDFQALLAEYGSEPLVYLPVSERPTRRLYRYLAENGKPANLHYLLPREEDFNMTSNKYAFQQFCESKGFPVPRSYDLHTIDPATFPFRPLILKPRSGEGSVGIKHIDKPEDMQKIATVDPNTYLLQEKIVSAQKVSGAFFLCRRGEVISHYTHQRLRTFPENGGVTVFSRSSQEQPLIDAGTALLRELEWDGVAMIEYLYDEATGAWKIIELNPRLWGSVLLSAFNGSEMLKQYVETCLDTADRPAPRPAREVYIRWWFPFELLGWAKRQISLRELLRFRPADTCYINITYSTWYRSLSYLLYFSVNVKSIKRYLKKLS